MADQRRSVSGNDVDIILTLMDNAGAGLRLLIETHGGFVRAWLTKNFRSLDHAHIEAALNTAHHQMLKFASKWDESRGQVRGCYLTFSKRAALNILRDESKHYQDRTDFEVVLEGEAGVERPCDPTPEPGSPRAKKNAAFLATIQELAPVQRRIAQADLEAGGQASARWLADTLGTTMNSIYVNRGRAYANIRAKMKALGFYRD